MYVLEQIKQLKQLDLLIRLKATGSPRELGDKLEVSERQARRIIDEMKSMGLPIAYCKKEKHYFYKSEVQMKFEIAVVKGDKLKKIIGGAKKDFDFLNLFFTRTFFDRDTAQLCSKLANNGFSHLAGGTDASFKNLGEC
jgi:biotin operon repressor